MKYNPHLNRVMLVFPPSTSLASWEPMVTPPMGALYLAAAVRSAGYEVTVLDTVLEAPYQETAVTEHISRFGLTYDQIMRRIQEARPDVVGLSCIFSNQWPAVRELARRIKQADPDIIVMTGGAHPTFLSERCLRDAPVDFILRGESEQSLPELLDALKHERPLDPVDGLVRRDGDAVRANPKQNFIADLDALPFPAHDLVGPERYFKLALPMAYSFINPRNVPVVTSRGCPCQCTFCSSTQLWGRRYRTRSADNVMAELDWLVQTFGVKEIKFQDDNLTINRQRAEDIFQQMTDRPWHLHWNTPNGIAVWTLDEHLLRKMKSSGCFEITMAVESGNQEVMTKLIKKPLRLDKVREINQAARKLGIFRMAYFIIGFPGETRAQIMDTVRFYHELRLEGCSIFIFNPLPGSPLYDDAIARGYITEDSFFEIGNQYYSSVMDSEQWTAEELEGMIRWEYLRTYLAVFYSPRLVLRKWLNFFRYRPSFMKFLLIRTRRTLKLKFNKTRTEPPGPGG